MSLPEEQRVTLLKTVIARLNEIGPQVQTRREILAGSRQTIARMEAELAGIESEVTGLLDLLDATDAVDREETDLLRKYPDMNYGGLHLSINAKGWRKRHDEECKARAEARAAAAAATTEGEEPTDTSDITETNSAPEETPNE